MNEGNSAAPTVWEKRRIRARLALVIISNAATYVFLFFTLSTTDTGKQIEFSMELAAVEGLNGTVGRTVSPAFNLTVHVENAELLQAWCSNGGEVLVSYSGVSLAWGHVPVFCVQRMAAAEVTVLTWGWEVGLSEDLRRRLVSEWHTGTAQVLVEMKIFDLGSPMMIRAYRGTSLHRFKLMVRDGEGQSN